MRPPLGRAPAWDADCSSSRKLLLSAIQAHWPNPYPSISRLAAMTSLADSTVRLLLAQMRTDRWITWIPGNGPNQVSNTYTIHWQAIPALVHSPADHRRGLSTGYPRRLTGESHADHRPLSSKNEEEQQQQQCPTAVDEVQNMQKQKRKEEKSKHPSDKQRQPRGARPHSPTTTPPAPGMIDARTRETDPPDWITMEELIMRQQRREAEIANVRLNILRAQRAADKAASEREQIAAQRAADKAAAERELLAILDREEQAS